MALSLRLCVNLRPLSTCYNSIHTITTSACLQGTDPEVSKTDDDFRVLELGVKKRQFTKRRVFAAKPILPPRYKQQKVDQNWGDVWPTARSFHPAAVPLPVRQGYPATNQATPDKWGNAELMKIPNFLHLTPPVIERQCKALKKFCTAWPSGLETREKQEKHFPLTVSASTYLHSSPSIRDTKARIVTFKVSLESLALDDHSRDKLLRLVGDRYDPDTDVLTLVADRCPVSQQNEDYCRYLLTVLYKESLKIEPWEHEKEAADRELYLWEGSPSQKAMKTIIEAREEEVPSAILEDYEKAVSNIHNEGEDALSVSKYREAVLKVIGLST